MSPATALTVLILLAQTPAPAGRTDGRSAELNTAHRAILTRESEDLRTLGRRLEARGRRDDAAAVGVMVPPPPSRSGPVRFRPLAEVVTGDAPDRENGSTRGTLSREARTEVEAVRGKAVVALMDLATRAAQADRWTLAAICLHEVLERDPHHAEARRLLGFVPYKGGWATPFAVKMLREKKERHPIFGWVDQSWVPHLEKGELPAPRTDGRPLTWLPAADADAMRGSWAEAWEVGTEHFSIRADVPLAEAIGFGRRLEEFYDIFGTLMADALGPRQPLARRFRNPRLAPAIDPKIHRVFYFGSKQEYVDHLLPRCGPRISKSLGIYLETRKLGDRGTSYFYKDQAGQIAETATLYHEVSHQLLFELMDEVRLPLNPRNYWVFEGLGTYFETLVEQPDGSIALGGFEGKRIEVARVRIVDRKEFVPMAKLTAMDKEHFNAGSSIYLHYAEAMALTLFFMQYEDQRYRDAFLDYVRDIARGRMAGGRSARQLDSRVGVPFAELDRQFLAYLKGDE